jgi:cation diffusion facilitator CzcD-associated flavoprotein CzcO
MSDARTQQVSFLVIGAGFSGLGAAIRLTEAGHRDLVVLERASDVGGTWRDNVYPGCRCDVPSNLYSYSFAAKPDWSETFPSQPELWDYLRRIVRTYRLGSYLRFGHEVASARWDGTRSGGGRWLVRTSQATFAARYLIAGVGALVEPSLPDIPGISTFRGAVMHSARWDQGWQATGRRVAVVGTGASAIQIVPAIQPDAAHVTVFQRTAPFVMPHTNRPVRPWAKALYRALPPAQRVARLAIYWGRELLCLGFTRYPGILKRATAVWRRLMASAISDPVMRAQLTPAYDLGCKRIVPSC